MRAFTASLIVLAACGGSPEQSADETLLPRDAVIRCGDDVRIDVDRHPELALAVRVPPEGTVACPLIGAVALAGRLPVEVAREVEERLARGHLDDPRVSVAIAKGPPPAPPAVVVEGAVPRPGALPIPPGRCVTVTQAISMAGGFLPVADERHVRVSLNRKGKDPEEVVVDVNRILTGGQFAEDIELSPGDVVHVPRQ